jgi:hypothetical protein
MAGSVMRQLSSPRHSFSLRSFGVSAPVVASALTAFAQPGRNRGGLSTLICHGNLFWFLNDFLRRRPYVEKSLWF